MTRSERHEIYKRAKREFERIGVGFLRLFPNNSLDGLEEAFDWFFEYIDSEYMFLSRGETYLALCLFVEMTKGEK